MTRAVAHINLLQRTAPAHTTAWGLAALLALTVAGMLYYGNQVRSVAHEAVRHRDEVAQQLKQMQDRMTALTGEQVRNAEALAVRREIDVLRPQAQAAQALVDAVHTADGGRTEEFSRALAAMTGVNEAGLWLTSVTVSAGGKKLDLKGEARSGALVLRFARRTNESLRPLSIRLESLEMQPAAAPASGPHGSTVQFHLY